MMRRALLAVTLVLLVLVIGVGVWVRGQLRGSLPQLDGMATVAGLSAPVDVTRDALGTPTVRGAARVDVARATGFLHAQERFFQMDLARRRAAGELAALAGAAALPLDREIRLHRFRAVAARAHARLPPRDRAALDAYAAGVNAGLDGLEVPPFEYLLLRRTPAPWRPEDSLLVVLSMFITLQDTDGAYERTLATMHDVLPGPVFDFLAPAGTEWDAPIAGEAFGMPSVPGPDVYDLRARRAGKPAIELPDRQQPLARGADRAPGIVSRVADLAGWGSGLGDWQPDADARAGAMGSNNWAVSGAHTTTGRPLVANDMHLSVRVPNTWYRAALEWLDPAEPSGRRRLVGLTLPGVPALVAGSNGHVVWGFTNTYADWSDIVLLEVDPEDPDRYRTPTGWRRFERHTETIEVAGRADERVEVVWTIWGPVIGPDHRGRQRAYRWVAHDASRLARTGTPIETAHTVRDVFDAANGLGAPGQNLVAADRDGRIGWSVYGSIPRRVGLDGRLPASWADGTAGWSGWLDAAEYPRIVDPPSGRIWTANARVVGGGMLALLGDGSYEVGSRATIIRDRLMAQERFSREDLLEIQLDVSAVFLSRWRDLMLRTLTAAAVDGREARAIARDIVRDDWTGRADPDSAAYRLTRAFRDRVSRRVIAFVLAECYEADPVFDYLTVRRREGPIWALVTGQPTHLLDPAFQTWDALLLAALDEVLAELSSGRPADLRQRVWSEYNVTAYRHPLSSSVPLAGRWLDMPLRPLPGDLFTPRMHWGAAAASQRLIASPGYEAEGILHMPTGQSGHPLSPFYGNSHEAWVRGEPTPLLPGPAVHTLRLVP